MCIHLQRYEALSEKGNNNFHLYLKDWISNKLTADRYRYSQKLKEKAKRKKDRQTKGNNSSDESDKPVRKNKMQTKGSRNRKFTLLEDSSDSSKDNGIHIANEKTKRKDELRPFCDLLSLLRHSRYPVQLTSANSHDGNDPTALYSWEELYKEMRWTDV